MNQKDFDNLGTEQDTEDQSTVEPDQTEETTDPIALLGQELKLINEHNTALLKRLDEIESRLSQPERERNLPPAISRSQLTDVSFLRKHGVTMEDISSGKVRVEG